MLLFRSIEPSDHSLICRHRVAMFADGGKRAESELAEMDKNFRQWLVPRLSDGTYFGFVAEDRKRAVAGIGLMELSWPPHPLHMKDDRRGYVLNMFVEPSHRRQGIARELMKQAEQAFNERGIRYAILHATADGRAVYEKFGWSATSEMGKILSSRTSELMKFPHE
ncbi:MAG: GNAT family N-acetyltransferase [Stappiaceae bacterium]